MTWLGLYCLIGLITTVVLIKTGVIEKGDEHTPAMIVFIFWPFFIFIFGIVGVWYVSEWLFFGIAEHISLPNIKFKVKK